MNVLYGVTGGVAAVNANQVISGLTATGHSVRVIVTKNALNFITEMSLSVASKNRVTTTMWNEVRGDVEHISNAQWADAMLIAPATANIIGKIANGIADDCLSTTVMALKEKTLKILAPAMNTRMWLCNPLQRNLKVIKEDGWQVINPIEGMLACGTQGIGIMEKPRKIVTKFNELRFKQEEQDVSSQE